MSDRLTHMPEQSAFASTQGQQLARMLEQGKTLDVERAFGALQNSSDHGWKTAQAMKAMFDSDAVNKNGFPDLKIDLHYGRVDFLLNAPDAHPITAAGRIVDSLPLPDFVKGMVDGTKESHDALNQWDASFGRNAAITLEAVGLNNSGQTAPSQLYRMFLHDPDRLRAVNVYLPRDQQLKIIGDAQSSSESCTAFDFGYKFGNQTARFPVDLKNGLCSMLYQK